MGSTNDRTYFQLLEVSAEKYEYNDSARDPSLVIRGNSDSILQLPILRGATDCTVWEQT